MEIKYPDFTNSLVNITSSIKKHFKPDLKLEYQSIKLVDDLIKDKKKVILILLDGMGVNILKGNLDEDSFLRSHLVGEATSVFPPTTVAATNAILTGMLPGENGWFGWQQYFKENNHHYVMFKNIDYYTEDPLDADIKNKYVVNHQFGMDLGIKYNVLFPSVAGGNSEDFSDEVDKIIDIIKEDKPSLTYAYWTNPDGLIHEYGCFNEVIKANLLKLSADLERLEANMDEDSIALVIADHGLIDVSPIDLAFYDDIKKYLRVLPSLEGRSMIFFVNDKEGFKKEFNDRFSKWFDLYTTDEFLALGLVGKKTDKILPFMGDYIALAKDKYYFMYDGNLDAIEMKGHHAGITKDEMMIPIIKIGGNK